MILWHRMHGRLTKTVLTATMGWAAFGLAAMPASAQSTEWYRQPAAPGAAPQPAPQPAAQPQPAPAPADPMPQPGVAGNGGAANGAAVFAPPAVNPVLRPYQMPGINNPYGGYGSVSGLYPSSEMNNYVNATARAAMARALFRQAESELGQAYRAAQRGFDGSAEYKRAIKEEQDAYAALTAARTKALASLEDNEKYQRLLALREDLAAKLLDGRVYRTLGPDEVVAMATLKMSYATEMRSIEADALANESSVKDAQDRLVEAGTRVSEMRQQFEDSLRVDPQVLMARQNLDDARVAKLASEAYLRAAIVNGRQAINYAYYLYRTPSRYDTNNGYYGYGY